MTETAISGDGRREFDPVPSFLFDTQGMSAGHDVDVWRGIVDEFYDVIPLQEQQQPFTATMTTWNLGGVLLAGGVFTEQRFSRSATRARRDGFDPYTVLLHRSGHWRADTGGHVVIGSTGFGASANRGSYRPGQAIFAYPRAEASRS